MTQAEYARLFRRLAELAEQGLLCEDDTGGAEYNITLGDPEAAEPVYTFQAYVIGAKDESS